MAAFEWQRIFGDRGRVTDAADVPGGVIVKDMVFKFENLSLDQIQQSGAVFVPGARLKSVGDDWELEAIP